MYKYISFLDIFTFRFLKSCVEFSIRVSVQDSQRVTLMELVASLIKLASLVFLDIKFQVSSLLREIKKNTKSDVPLLAVSYSYSRRAVA